ncbi:MULTISPECIES: hypothetical protein [unclassified Mesorhizobium]|uniref:hypothetical protein n=1 Tax=unclassified Mesorhizobium TaxID=325217 RepID=UPI00333712BB
MTQIAIPAGDSIFLPGLDGELHSKHGNAWVPAGYSCWEMSCRADTTVKANEDFEKRAFGISADTRSDRTYVALTARRWSGKSRWKHDKIGSGLWKDVRAYDADDLEQWLEQCPAVALRFAEELGIYGPGVESLATFLEKWCVQSFPRITPEALQAGRAEHSAKLVERISRVLDRGSRDPLAIKADSVQEAAAFAAASLLGNAALAASAIVVTGIDGWRFVEANPNIRIAIAATPMIAEAPTSRPKLVIIIPYASGDMARQFRGVAGQPDDNELQLERAMHSEFEKALQLIGLDENETRRLSVLCGRSWSVFRRQHATNPAIRRPAWLDHPASSALGAVCLVGNWSSGHEADMELVSRIAGRPYAEIEADLLELERLDDSPLLHIGSVWKAKSALELLAIFGDQIGKSALDRYIREVEGILVAPDPQLGLPEEQRYAAAIHNKTRPISALLLEALCDTLVKLAVRGPEVPSLAANNISLRIDRLVRSLLRGADRVRWMSLADQLPALAEASPHEFLVAVEKGIGDPNGGVCALFIESKGTDFGQRCWHAGMLWALETLAWAPHRLKRVSLILAWLCDVRIEGNWGNNPKSSLHDLYRSWFPQTAAAIEQRIDALDFLIEKAPGHAYELLDDLTGPGPDSASHIARPKWRGDDAGAGYGATGPERHKMMVAAIDRQIEMSRGEPGRIARLIGKYAMLDEPRQRRILELLAGCRDASDFEKENIRRELRYTLHWHRNYDEVRDEAALGALLDPLDVIYASVEPEDLIVRHAWLFRNSWVDLPIRTRGDDFEEEGRQRTGMARAALREIFNAQRWAGVLALATGQGEPWVVGSHLSRIGLPQEDLERWIAQESGDLQPGGVATILAGAILCGLSLEDRSKTLDAVFARKAHRDVEWSTRLLILCPHDPNIWRRAEALGQSDLFWSNCSANLWLDECADMAFALRSLVARRRPVSALNACHIKFSPYDPQIIAEMLEGVLQGHEVSESRVPASYVFERAIDYLEVSGQIDEMRLVKLEFALIQAMGFGKEHHAKSLYFVLMSRPEVFVELLCMIYNSRHSEAREIDEVGKAAAANAWHVLHACKQQPGTGKDAIVDPETHAQFIHETRTLAKAQDRLEVCDITLGEIMAHAPEGVDGIWPFEPARRALEETGSQEMLNGFRTGCFNKRGVHSRGAYEGGDQERDLAIHYREHALALEPTHPCVSAVLIDLARSYDQDGIHEDFRARLRQEGH